MAKFTSFYCKSAMCMIIMLCTLSSYSFAATTSYNVMTFGAKPNGVIDSTEAFIKAWSAACSTTTSATVILVPKGRYLLRPIAFEGECKSSYISFKIEGTLVAPADYRVLGKVDDWLSFNGVSGVSIIGGALDANGPALWACKATGKDCPSGATVSTYTDAEVLIIHVDVFLFIRVSLIMFMKSNKMMYICVFVIFRH